MPAAARLLAFVTHCEPSLRAKSDELTQAELKRNCISSMTSVLCPSHGTE